MLEIPDIQGDEELAFVWQSYDAEEGREFISYFLMDSLLEEALELIGAAALLAGVLSIICVCVRRNRINLQEKNR